MNSFSFEAVKQLASKVDGEYSWRAQRFPPYAGTCGTYGASKLCVLARNNEFVFISGSEASGAKNSSRAIKLTRPMLSAQRRRPQ